MSIAEIRQLPLRDKLQIMEAIWEDLRANAEVMRVSEGQKQLLDSRRKAVEGRVEKILKWDDVKHTIGTRQP